MFIKFSTCLVPLHVCSVAPLRSIRITTTNTMYVTDHEIQEGVCITNSYISITVNHSITMDHRVVIYITQLTTYYSRKT